MDENNPQSPVPENVPTPWSPAPSTTMSIRKKTLLIIGAIILIISISILVFLSFKKSDTFSSFTKSSPENKAIAKIGNETIYQKDLDAELANFPGANDPETKKMLLEKLIKDSIILQAAQKDKLIQLNDTVYNAPDKNYMKRIADIQTVEKKVDMQTDHISGTMISVWFDNQIPPKIGVAEAKKQAFEKITALHKKVASKEMTMEQAAQSIVKDPTYADLDVGYENNAKITFDNPKGKQITVDSHFDDILWETKPSDITPVYLGKVVDDTGKVKEAYYIFGKVDKKIDNGTTMDFTKWYNTQKNNYEVTYY